MLTVTAAAADSITRLAEYGGVCDEGGLRVEIAPHDKEGGTFALSLAAAPSEGDEVLVVRRGTNVFMDHAAVTYLSDKILDIRKDHDVKIKFRLLRQR